jgi:hypothetical protein
MSEQDPNGRRLPPGEEPDEGLALAEAEDARLLELGLAVLAELKDRNLLRILLRHRADAACAFEAESVTLEDDTLEIVAEGFHAETPDHYAVWVQEAAALHDRLRDAPEEDLEAEAMLLGVSDQALLIALDQARDEAEAEDAPPEAEELGARIGVELLRRGVMAERLEDGDEPP